MVLSMIYLEFTVVYYKLPMFIPVDMEIVTPRSTSVRPETQACSGVLKGVAISISTGIIEKRMETGSMSKRQP